MSLEKLDVLQDEVHNILQSLGKSIIKWKLTYGTHLLPKTNEVENFEGIWYDQAKH